MGVHLLNLPEEILQCIARHFTLVEWIQGPAQTCRLFHRMELPRIDLHCDRARFGMDANALIMASDRISKALACADRHTGPCTASISLSTQSVLGSLINSLGQPGPLTSPAIIVNVACLELQLTCCEDVDDDYIRDFLSMVLQRLPNLIATKLALEAFYRICLDVPLLHLKQYDLCVGSLETLEGMPFAALFPSLETACISALVSDAAVSELDMSGCPHLRRLVLGDVMVFHLSKPPQCKLRVEMVTLHSHSLKAGWPQTTLAEVSELLSCDELYLPEGLIATARLPKLEVIRCDRCDDEFLFDDGNGDDFEGSAASVLVSCMRHSSSLPALRSILWGDYDNDSQATMKVRIPAELAGVQELIVATDRPLHLVFDSARSAGERLDTFCAVASEITVRVAAILEMVAALSRCGLALSMAQADGEHMHAPSQCLYVHALSILPLSYDDVMCSVNARVERWGHKGDDACGQCGACFKCLRKAGVLDS